MVQAKTNKAATPAPKAETAVQEPKAVDVDFTSLTLEDAPTEALKRSRTTILDRSPVLGWLKESFESDKAKAVTVPKDQAKPLERLIRSGADRLKIGVSVTITPLPEDKARVAFLGKDRREYKPRPKKTATAPAAQ